MTKTTRIPTEEMLAILQQVAEKKGKVWEFRLPFDQAFVDKYSCWISNPCNFSHILSSA